MNPHQSSNSLFDRLRFVLVGTSHPGNVGAAARAIKTMGFRQLVLVDPRFPDVLSHEEAIAFASGAQDVLQQARIAASFDEAIEGCNFAAAVSARLREFSPPVTAPRPLARRLAEDERLTAAVVFGSERYGLPNEVIARCNVLINIPANPEYSSLNLAQAVQLLAWEARQAACGDDVPVQPIGFQGEAAELAEVEGMFQHLEQALVAIDFLDPRNPKKLMPRLRRLFSRSQLEKEEVNILRGIANKILNQRKS